MLPQGCVCVCMHMCCPRCICGPVRGVCGVCVLRARVHWCQPLGVCTRTHVLPWVRCVCVCLRSVPRVCVCACVFAALGVCVGAPLVYVCAHADMCPPIVCAAQGMGICVCSPLCVCMYVCRYGPWVCVCTPPGVCVCTCVWAPPCACVCLLPLGVCVCMHACGHMPPPGVCMCFLPRECVMCAWHAPPGVCVCMCVCAPSGVYMCARPPPMCVHVCSCCPGCVCLCACVRVCSPGVCIDRTGAALSQVHCPPLSQPQGFVLRTCRICAFLSGHDVGGRLDCVQVCVSIGTGQAAHHPCSLPSDAMTSPVNQQKRLTQGPPPSPRTVFLRVFLTRPGDESQSGNPQVEVNAGLRPVPVGVWFLA